MPVLGRRASDGVGMADYCKPMLEHSCGEDSADTMIQIRWH